MLDMFFATSEPVLYQQLIDGIFALIFYALILRLVILTFVTETINSGRLRLLSTLTSAVLTALKPLTPRRLNRRASEAYAIFSVFLVRYYALPALLGYEMRGITSLPFEKAVFGLVNMLG